MKGVFIALEGPEGAGKSTQARLLGERLRSSGCRVLVTREPGGTVLGEQIRRLLLDHGSYAMLGRTEALLYAAARAQHVDEVLRPAVVAGSVVVCDRFVDSSFAYQGGGRELAGADFEAVQRFATAGLLPDLRILLDLPVSVGLARRFAAEDGINRLDAADMAFHERVRKTYRALAAGSPNDWVVVDATAPADEVLRCLETTVRDRLGDLLPSTCSGEPAQVPAGGSK